MLSDRKAVATIAVRDVRAARDFYLGKLGLNEAGGGEPSVLTLKSGGSKTFVYESKFAGTNKATAATWTGGEEIGSIVRDVHVAGRMKAAWFKDPDGNILSLVNG